LERWAQAAQERNLLQEVREALEEALAIYREQTENVAAGRVLTALTAVLQRIGAPGQEETLAEALALLEAQPPGLELVNAYGEQAARYAIRAAYPESIAVADRALTLAAELGLPEPVRILGFRGTARCFFGERRGLGDMRQALQLAVDQGLSRVAANVHNNLALGTWLHEGPQAAFTACKEGVDFCEQRGISMFGLEISGMGMTFAAACGLPQQVLADALLLAERLQAAGSAISTEALSAQMRVLAERGAHEQAPAPDQLLAVARETAEPQICALAFGAASRLLLAQGDRHQAEALLVELQQVVQIRADPYYGWLLPELVRIARAVGNPELAARLVHGVEPPTPLVANGLISSRAQLAEAGSDCAEAASLYADAAQRWQQFGDVPEHAYALLGQGRCLLTLGEPAAEQPLREAGELFSSMGYRPALAEAEALIAQTTALAS
jgi:hypothetical protein